MSTLQKTIVNISDARASHAYLDRGKTLIGPRSDQYPTAQAPLSLQGAVASHNALRLVEFARSALLNAALEDLHCGVILLDAHCGILFANRRAQSILDRADALIASEGRLRFLQSTMQEQFSTCLAMGPTDSPPTGETQRRMVMRVPRKTGAMDYVLIVRSTDTEVHGHVVFVYDFERDGLAPELLKHAYGLTNAEARLATHLYDGQSMQATARTLGIRESTARSHLTKILSKCSVGSLAGLLQLLALGPLTQ